MSLRVKRIEKVCQSCRVVYLRRPKELQAQVSRFCSRKCQTFSQRKRITRPCKICGDDFTVRVSEVKKYLTCSHQCWLENKKGTGNPNYRHGNRPGDRSGKEYKSWRNSVYERDDYTCQMCGKRGGELHADHIKPWAYFESLRYKISNGRTLCVPCHYTTYKDVFKHRKEKICSSSGNQLVKS